MSTCLVVLTDPLYLPGTLRLLDSWDRCNPALPLVALSRHRETLDDARLAGRCSQRRLIDATAYADIRPYKKRHSQRHGETFYKFETFRDFGYQRNLFLDSDLLSLRPAPRLYEATPDGALLAAPETGFRKTRAYKGHPSEINSGVLSIPASLLGERTVAQLQQLARDEPGRGGYNAGDQAVINKWIHRQSIPLELLPSAYNLIKKDYADTVGIERCRLLHFAARKPWFPSDALPQALERLWRGE